MELFPVEVAEHGVDGESVAVGLRIFLIIDGLKHLLWLVCVGQDVLYLQVVGVVDVVCLLPAMLVTKPHYLWLRECPDDSELAVEGRVAGRIYFISSGHLLFTRWSIIICFVISRQLRPRSIGHDARSSILIISNLVISSSSAVGSICIVVIL